MRAGVLGLAALAGCGSPQLACDADPHGWYHTPTMSLMQANGRGDFDYDPPSEVVTRRWGTSSRGKGTLEWGEEAVAAYPIVEVRADGLGSWERNGDLDVAYTLSSRDVLGQNSGTNAQVKRTGCAETWTETISDFDGSVTEVRREATLVSDVAVDYSSVLVETSGSTSTTIDISGTVHDDLSAEWVIGFTAGDWVYEGQGVDHADGSGSQDWSALDERYTYEGHYDYQLEGSLDHDYEVIRDGIPTAHVTYHQEYDGSAEGLWRTWDPNDEVWTVCEYVFSDDYCTRYCPDQDPIDCDERGPLSLAAAGLRGRPAVRGGL